MSSSQTPHAFHALAWNAFYGYCQPPAMAGATDAHANHWGIDVGSLHITSMDSVTNGTGDFGTYNESPAQMTSMYGANQADDAVADLTGSTAAFKTLTLSQSLRYLKQGATTENSYLAQHPLFNHCLVEYKRLMTDSTTSLLRHPQTSGAAGNLVTVSGDLHRACVMRHHSDEYTDNQGEHFECWHTGTVNGSANMDNDTGLISGDEFVGTDGTTKTKLLYDDPVLAPASTDKHFHVIRQDIYGSENPKRMVMTLIDRDGVEVYSRQYIHSQGNLSQTVGTGPQSSGISSEDA